MLHLQLSMVLFVSLMAGCSGRSTSWQDHEESHASRDPRSHQMPLDTELATTKKSCRLVFDWYAPDSLEYTLSNSTVKLLLPCRKLLATQSFRWIAQRKEDVDGSTV